MAKRRRLRGKQLLIVSGAIAGMTFMGCGDAVANLIAPPPDSATDGSTDASMDAADTATGDTATGDAAPTDAMPDGIALDAVANLIAPPDVGADATPDADAG